MSGVYGPYWNRRKSGLVVRSTDFQKGDYEVSEDFLKSMVGAAECFERKIAGPPVMATSFGDVCVPATPSPKRGSPKGKERAVSVETISSTCTMAADGEREGLGKDVAMAMSQEPILVAFSKRIKTGQHRNYYVKILANKWADILALTREHADVERLFEGTISLLEVLYFVDNNYNYGNCMKREGSEWLFRLAAAKVTKMAA
jgi:hypothetical protein